MWIENESKSDCNNPDRKPVTFETHEAPPQDGDQPVPEKKLSTISDMVRDGFVFFTPALIVTHGLFDRDPIVEFNRTHYTTDETDRPFQIDCEYPFFQGLGKSLIGGDLIDWDHRLYGIHGDYWEQLRDFVGSIAIYDPKRYHYAKIGYHNLRIVDPTALHNGEVKNELDCNSIWVFFVDAYRYFVWMAPAKDPPRTHPYAKVEPPRPEIKAEAEAVLGPPPSPEKAGSGL